MYLSTKNYRDFTVLEDGVVMREFHDAKLARKCLNGDTVSIDCETGCMLVKRANHPIIAGLVELKSKVKYGFTTHNVPIYLFVPYNESYPPFVVGCSEHDVSVNRIGLIRFENDWKETFPRGHLVRLLDIGAEEEALFWNYSPIACEKYKGTFPDFPSLQGRRQLNDSFHIDPVGCKDVDDVLNIDVVDGLTYVTITIADVSASIPVNHPLDIRASAICQTFYQDGVQPKHMFPPFMSEGYLSLLKGSRKPGLSLRVCLLDLSVEWFESAVSVEQSFDYDSIYTSDLVHALKLMSAAFGHESDDSHVWIESAMKFYNIQVAKLLKAEGLGVLRSHSAPDLQRYKDLDPSLEFLAMTSAKYVLSSSSDCKHWGLNEEAYTHATSPIRRYADLLNQRCLKAIVFGNKDLISIGNVDRLNRVAKSAKQHDRDLVFLKALKKAPSGTVTGSIIEIKDKGDLRKLSIYVKEWSVIVKLKYKPGVDFGHVLSKDEKSSIPVSLGLAVSVAYNSNLHARCWKQRIILRLVEPGSST